MKYNTVFFIFMLFFICNCFFVGCARESDIKQSDISASLNDKSSIEQKNLCTDISLDLVKGITEDEAINLCFDVLETQDENLGYPISYRCTGAVECVQKQYYVMNMSWFVENDHWSNIGELLISADGDAIYDCYRENNNYYLGDLIWQK